MFLQMSVPISQCMEDPYPVANPGFRRVRLHWGVPGHNFIKISQKLHEIKENWAP